MASEVEWCSEKDAEIPNTCILNAVFHKFLITEHQQKKTYEMKLLISYSLPTVSGGGGIGFRTPEDIKICRCSSFLLKWHSICI